MKTEKTFQKIWSLQLNQCSGKLLCLNSDQIKRSLKSVIKLKWEVGKDQYIKWQAYEKNAVKIKEDASETRKKKRKSAMKIVSKR